MGNKINNIQVLRFFAALSVMMVHLPLFGFGAWGVDFFFVISGFIMMYITDISSKFFFLKRLARIIPLYWILTILVFCLALTKPELLNNTTPNFEHLLKSLFFIPFDKNNIGHFPVLFLGWSLNYEILFYITFSFSLVVSRRYRAYVCSVILVLIFLTSSFFSGEDFIFQVYSESIILEFIIGMFIYKFYVLQKNSNSQYFIYYNFLFIILLILVSIAVINFDLPRFFSYGTMGALVLFFFLFFIDDNFFPKIFILLGDASFAIYLVHPYIIQFFYKILKIDDSNIISNLLVSALSVALTLLVSILIYKYLEKPINIKIKKLFKTS